MDTENNQNITPPLTTVKKGTGWLVAIIIILGLGAGFLIFLHFDQKSKMKEMELVLNAEKDSLTHELSNLSFQYDTLKTTRQHESANCCSIG